MTFEHLFIGDTPVVIGKGTDIDDIELEGTREGSTVIFDKFYYAFPSYYIVYEGQMSEDDTVITGTYQIWRLDTESDYNDAFIISPNKKERGDFELTKEFVTVE